jgi:predicted nuclease with TOPRIM domain
MEEHYEDHPYTAYELELLEQIDEQAQQLDELDAIIEEYDARIGVLEQQNALLMQMAVRRSQYVMELRHELTALKRGMITI